MFARPRFRAPSNPRRKAFLAVIALAFALIAPQLGERGSPRPRPAPLAVRAESGTAEPAGVPEAIEGAQRSVVMFTALEEALGR